MVRKTVMLTMAAGVLAASCGGSGSDDSAVAGAASCTASGDRVSITADGMEYDKSCLAVPADRDFTISFDNDGPMPHNVEILKGDDSLFSGDIFTGPEKTDYRVQALPTGTYRFLCTVHPTQMKGTLLVQ